MLRNYFIILLLLFSAPVLKGQDTKYNMPDRDTLSASDIGVIAIKDFNENIATANTNYLNTLLKQADSRNKIIVLPKGRIWISGSVHIPSNSTIVGNAGGSSFAIAPQFANAEEGFIENENYNLGNLLSDSAITLENFTVEGNGINPAKGQSRGIFLNKVKDIVIRNISVVNTVREGIRIDCSVPALSSENVLIENCRVDRRGFTMQNIMLRSFTEDAFNSTGIPARVSNITIRKNISIGGTHGIAAFNSKDVLIYDNCCLANSHRGIIVSPTSSHITIRKNIVDSAGSTGIHLAYFASDIMVDSNIVTNTVADMSRVGQEGQGIKAYAGFSDITITNNTSKNNATDGIALEGGGAGDNFTIKNNTCQNNHRNGIRIWAGEITLKKGANITNGRIEKNRLKNNGSDAFAIGSDNEGRNTVQKVTILSNTIKAKKGKKKYSLQYADKSVKMQ